jgi:hypothetical protein
MSRRSTQLPVRDGDNAHGTTFKHPAFATVQVTETSGGSGVLFGSDVDHQYKIRLSIQRAYIKRDLNHDWIHATNAPMIEVEMSHAQFAALTGSIGKGGGVPCTLRYAPVSSAVSDVPYIERLESKLDTFSREVEESAKRQVEAMRAQIARMGVALESGKLGVKEAREIHRSLDNMAANLPKNLGYTVNQAQEMLEKAGNDAKTQIEAFADSTARRLGLDNIAELGQIGRSVGRPSDAPLELGDDGQTS